VSAGVRVAVLGATGALGSEVLALLAESSLRVSELLPLATDRSLGHEVEFRGAVHPVLTEARSLRGLDLVFLCAPPAVSLEGAREALRAEVPCVDVSGALAGSPEVPLRVAAFEEEAPRAAAPLLVAPPGAALPPALVLRPLARAAGLRRVVGTLLEGASAGGREGIERLYRESIALFNQEDLPASDVFGRPVAFDCLPAPGPAEARGGHAAREGAVVDALGRLLEAGVRVSLTAVQVPVFVGLGAALAIETERPLEPKLAAEALAAAAGVEVWQGEEDALTLRASAGRDVVLVGRLRRDASVEHGLRLWLAADVLRVAAANAVRLAVARLALHH
jgi:aspartate-semialdehyde dehydrogenase